MEKTWAIVCGGQYSPLRDLGDCEYIIACDRGYEYVRRQIFLWGISTHTQDPCRRMCRDLASRWKRTTPTLWRQ